MFGSEWTKLLQVNPGLTERLRLQHDGNAVVMLYPGDTLCVPEELISEQIFGYYLPNSVLRPSFAIRPIPVFRLSPWDTKDGARSLSEKKPSIWIPLLVLAIALIGFVFIMLANSWVKTSAAGGVTSQSQEVSRVTVLPNSRPVVPRTILLPVGVSHYFIATEDGIVVEKERIHFTRFVLEGDEYIEQ